MGERNLVTEEMCRTRSDNLSEKLDDIKSSVDGIYKKLDDGTQIWIEHVKKVGELEVKHNGLQKTFYSHVKQVEIEKRDRKMLGTKVLLIIFGGIVVSSGLSVVIAKLIGIGK